MEAREHYAEPWELRLPCDSPNVIVQQQGKVGELFIAHSALNGRNPQIADREQVTSFVHRAAVCVNFLKGIPTETLEQTKAHSTVVQLFLTWMATRDDTVMAALVDEMNAVYNAPTTYVERKKLDARIKELELALSIRKDTISKLRDKLEKARSREGDDFV